VRSADRAIPPAGHARQEWRRRIRVESVRLYREYNPATVADPSGCCFWDVCIAEGAGVYLTAGAVAAAGYAWWETGGKERTEDAAAKLGDALDAGWQAAAAQIPQWFPPRELLRDPRTGNAVPVLDDDGNPVMAPHTLVGTRRSRGGRGLATHPQAREFDENGKLLGVLAARLREARMAGFGDALW